MKRMKTMSVVLFCFLFSIITIAVVMVGRFVIMIFSSGDDGIRKSFFNTIFFNSTTNKDGSTSMIFGFTGEFIPIIIAIIIVFLIYLLFSIVYIKLTNYKEKLIKEKKNYE